MKIIIISLFPDIIQDFIRWGIVRRAGELGLLDVSCINPRQFSDNKTGRIDDRPYGGGPGMVLQYPPIVAAIKQAKQELPDARVIYMSPQGSLFDQTQAQKLSQTDLILLAGRYEGIDQRIIDRWVDQQISIGSYVLSGGELPALVIIEACARLIPEAVGCAQSIVEESHSSWSQYDHPHYTRPESVDGLSVPDVLLSGDHQAIEKWRRAQRKKKPNP